MANVSLVNYRQTLAITNTATSTLTTLLGNEGTSIPAFQTFFNYVLLNIIFTPYTIYRYGIKRWLRLVLKDGWKCKIEPPSSLRITARYANGRNSPVAIYPFPFDSLMLTLHGTDIIFAFFDVEGNYFIVLAYRYTTILSAQLINFWAIVVVVVVSFLFLHVRYHWAQIGGILICIGGMGILIASDHITGSNGGDYSKGDQVKGDLFALLAATMYGLSNTTEEYFVSTRPMYEVIGQLSFFGMIIMGAQAGIFDRQSFRDAVWNGKVGGYLTGYTLCLSLFYILAPIMYRLSSAAFFNISLLTGNFWNVCIGIKVFHYSVHWMYPIAFVLIIIGQIIYYLGRTVLGEARKPWLGRNQEKGVSGIFTARRKIDTEITHERRASISPA